MSQSQVHIIHRQVYNIAVKKQQLGMRLQQHLHDFNLHYILPALSNKLDQLFKAEEITALDKVEIDIGTISSTATAEEWASRIAEKLEKELQKTQLKKKETDNTVFITKNKMQHAAEVLCWFLKTGSLMRGSLYTSMDEVLKQFAQTDATGKALLKQAIIEIADADVVTQRLAAMTSENQLFFLQLFIPDISKTSWRNLNKKILSLIEQLLRHKSYTGINSVTSVFYKVFRAAFLLLFAEAKENKSIPGNQFFLMVKALPQKILAGESLMNISVQDRQEEAVAPLEKEAADMKEDDMLIESNAVFIDNAGMSLVAAYLPSFFESLQLASGEVFYNNAKQQHAIYLLHYLATGEMSAGEERLLFAKLLCGWPLQMPCYNEEEISKEEIAASEELLQSLIEHWKALKKTSVSGLQEAFLQRGGKLTEKDDHFLLQAEQQTIDVLLDEVPWTFRLIKLPWMKKLIQVEWY